MCNADLLKALPQRTGVREQFVSSLIAFSTPSPITLSSLTSPTNLAFIEKVCSVPSSVPDDVLALQADVESDIWVWFGTLKAGDMEKCMGLCRTFISKVGAKGLALAVSTLKEPFLLCVVSGLVESRPLSDWKLKDIQQYIAAPESVVTKAADDIKALCDRLSAPMLAASGQPTIRIATIGGDFAFPLLELRDLPTLVISLAGHVHFDLKLRDLKKEKTMSLSEASWLRKAFAVADQFQQLQGLHKQAIDLAPSSILEKYIAIVGAIVVTKREEAILLVRQALAKDPQPPPELRPQRNTRDTRVVH